MVTRDDVIKTLRKKGYNGPIPPDPSVQIAVPEQAQQAAQQPRQSQGIVLDLVNKIDKSGTLAATLGRAARGYAAGAGIKLPEESTTDLLNKLKIQKLLEPKAPAPTGFVEVDGKYVQDPGFVDPKEQADIAYKASRIEKSNREEQDAVEAEKRRQEILRMDAESSLASIQKAKEGAGYFGPLGELPSIPILTGNYDKRVEWESNVNKLLSQKVVDVMTQMKQASKTGATGFGQLSNKELELLRQASTALNKRLSPDVAIQYLNKMEKIHKKVLGIGDGSSGRDEYFGGSGADGAIETGGGSPPGAAYFSQSTGKYYDEEGNEL